MARPSKLSRELRADVERELAAGVPLVVVAQRCRIGERTLRRWVADGLVHRDEASARRTPTDVVLASPAPAGDDDERDQAPVQERVAAAEAALVGVILESAKRGSWQAALALLERTLPGKWAKPASRPSEPAGDRRRSAEGLWAEIDELAAQRRKRVTRPR